MNATIPLTAQVRAMFEAAVRVLAGGSAVQLDVMVPLVGTAAELANQEGLVRRVAEQVRGGGGGRGGAVCSGVEVR